MSDPVHSHYRTKEEVESHRERDPIKRLSAYLEENGLATADEIRAMDREVSAEIKTAMEEALQSPEPSPDTVFDYVYRSDPVRRRAPLNGNSSGHWSDETARSHDDGETGSQSYKGPRRK
jgi:TPP-dependent pyruvate/acetoin dehydrogenase alpha subunit